MLVVDCWSWILLWIVAVDFVVDFWSWMLVLHFIVDFEIGQTLENHSLVTVPVRLGQVSACFDTQTKFYHFGFEHPETTPPVFLPVLFFFHTSH